ncbi:mechanosensitive ion channel family protein [Rosistilla oblonga]|uniref:mechanosensitive ion channel family protein n=1 Tax=Rosistilla oblonga TaxID=2527990 RepID=UPI003A97F25C
MQNEEPANAGEAAANGVNENLEVLKEEASNAFSSAMAGDFSQLIDMSMVYLPKAVLVILGVIVAYFVAKFVSRIAGTPVRRRVDETLGRFVSKVVFYAIMICVLLGVAGSVGINVTSFAAILGAAGFAVGLAFQGTLGNFASGILLLVFRPFKVGDVISAAGIVAKVNEIDLFTTTFDTPDNRRIIVPNSQIAGGTIENISFHKERRVDVSVGTEYSASLDLTRETLSKAAESLSDKMLTGEGRGYQIVLGELGDSAVAWTVRFWTRAEDFWGVKESLTRAVKNGLDEAGIGIPFPQLDVNLTGGPADTEAAGDGKIKPRLRQ